MMLRQFEIWFFQILIVRFNVPYIFLPSVLKYPEEPDKSFNNHKAVKNQDKHNWDCDYPNEDNNSSSGNFFKLEYLS